MLRIPAGSLLGIVPFVLLTACSTEDGASGIDSAAGTAANSSEEVPATAEHVAVRLALQGGNLPGTFERPADGGMCNDLTAIGQNAGSANIEPLSDDGENDPTGPRIFITGLAIDNMSAARSGGTNQFAFTGTVHDDKRRQEVIVRPARNEGSGTVTVQGEGPLFTARVQGRTADGVTVDATFTCER